MECIDCYKHRLCRACVLWFGCSRDNQEEPSEEKPDGCFKCDRQDCPKGKETKNEQ